MSWPSDRKPRFIVAFITGGIINQGDAWGGRSGGPAEFCIHDRAFGFSIVHRVVAGGAPDLVKVVEDKVRERCQVLNDVHGSMSA